MNEFKECLEKRRLVKYLRIKARVKDEIASAEEDLKDARDFFKRKRFKYATIAGYYSLFHSARALIFSKGYRERSHFCLRIAIKELFVKEKLLDPIYLEYLEEAVGLREAADYQSLYSDKGARKAILGADEFLKATQEILEI